MRTINDGFPIKQFNGIDIDTSIQSSSANYYTYSSRLVKFIVIHYTGNKKDTAKNNATFFHNGARKSSANYFMDEAECYQSVALNNAAWAVGGTSVYKHADCRNKNSISIEMCCSGNSIVSEKTINNTAYLCAELCKYIGITADTVDTFVLRHYDVWDKQCPAQWATNNSEGWIAFKEKVKSILRNEEGLTMEQYAQFTGMTADKMMEQMLPSAEKNIKTRLVLEAIAKAENIEISDEKIDEKLAEMAKSYDMEVEKLKELVGEAEKQQMKDDMAVQEAIDFLVENAVEK